MGVLDVSELVVGSGDTPADVADQLDRSLDGIDTAPTSDGDHPTGMRDPREERDETSARLAEETLQPPEPVR